MSHLISRKIIGIFLTLIIFPLVWGCSVPPEWIFVSEYNGDVIMIVESLDQGPLLLTIPNPPGDRVRLRNVAEGETTLAYIRVSEDGNLQVFPGISPEVVELLGFSPAVAQFIADRHAFNSDYEIRGIGLSTIKVVPNEPITLEGDFVRLTINDTSQGIIGQPIEGIEELEDFLVNVPLASQLATSEENRSLPGGNLLVLEIRIP